MFLNKEAIQAINVERRIEKVFVPEWDNGDDKAFVFVRELNAKEQDEWDNNVFVVKGLSENVDVSINVENKNARYAVIVACDEKGNAIFSKEDADWLGEKQSSAVSRIANAGRKLNGMSLDDAEKK